MDERTPSETELDALIEAALRDEPLLPAPIGLHARITERVALAALRQREQARFRNALLTGFAASVAIVAAAAALVAVTNFGVLLEHGIAGGGGLMDYHAARLSLAWPRYMESIGSAAFLGATAGLTWLFFAPLRGRVGFGRIEKPGARGHLQTR